MKYEYALQAYYNGVWIFIENGMKSLIEAKESLRLRKIGSNYLLRIVRRPAEWEEVVV